MEHIGTPMVFGLEQEYGITLVRLDQGCALAEAPHPMHLANAVVRGYRDATANALVGFDLAAEAPLSDMWGYEMPREQAHESQLTDTGIMDGIVLANRVLTNGSRWYVDHAHPELSGPEVTSVRDAVLYDRAGDAVALAGARAATTKLRGALEGCELRLYKNNTDGKGASYGSHENYLVPRAVEFADIVAGFTPFLVARGVLVGAGRLGQGQRGEVPGFQLTQRADFFEREVGLETTIRRPIINTRDEPHADPRQWRRLHVITGDANVSQVACLLKVGTAALVLAAIEYGLAPKLTLADPVAAMHVFSHDVRLRTTVPLSDGRAVTALDLLEAYGEAAGEAVERYGALGGEGPEVLELWAETLDLLRADPATAADRLDWAAKLAILQRLRERDHLAWDDARLAVIDLQYADIDPARGLGLALERKGRLQTVVTAAEIALAVTEPPATTRAYVRGRLVRDAGDYLWQAGWDCVTLMSRQGRRTLRLPDPLSHTQATHGRVLDAALAHGPDAVVEALTVPSA